MANTPLDPARTVKIPLPSSSFWEGSPRGPFEGMLSNLDDETPRAEASDIENSVAGSSVPPLHNNMVENLVIDDLDEGLFYEEEDRNQQEMQHRGDHHYAVSSQSKFHNPHPLHQNGSDSTVATAATTRTYSASRRCPESPSYKSLSWESNSSYNQLHHLDGSVVSALSLRQSICSRNQDGVIVLSPQYQGAGGQHSIISLGAESLNQLRFSPPPQDLLTVFQAAPLVRQTENVLYEMGTIDFDHERQTLPKVFEEAAEASGKEIAVDFQIATKDRLSAFLAKENGRILHFR